MTSRSRRRRQITPLNSSKATERNRPRRFHGIARCLLALFFWLGTAGLIQAGSATAAEPGEEGWERTDFEVPDALKPAKKKLKWRSHRRAAGSAFERADASTSTRDGDRVIRATHVEEIRPGKSKPAGKSVGTPALPVLRSALQPRAKKPSAPVEDDSPGELPSPSGDEAPLDAPDSSETPTFEGTPVPDDLDAPPADDEAQFAPTPDAESPVAGAPDESPSDEIPSDEDPTPEGSSDESMPLDPQDNGALVREDCTDFCIDPSDPRLFRVLSEISLDISDPPPTIRPEDRQPDPDRREYYRCWTDASGRQFRGRFLRYVDDVVYIVTPGGEERSIVKAELSILDSRYLGDLPQECPLGDDPFEPRCWELTIYTWKASALCHKPLYFEEVSAERYGHSWGPIMQPILSGAHFFGSVPLLPYKMGLEPPMECIYALGYYRPGSCAPYMLDPLPLSVRAAAFQAAAVTGGIAIIP